MGVRPPPFFTLSPSATACFSNKKKILDSSNPLIAVSSFPFSTGKVRQKRPKSPTEYHARRSTV